MIQSHVPNAVYADQAKKHEAMLQQLMKKRSMLGWLRFFVFVVTILLGWKVFTLAGAPGLFVAAAGIAVLLYLVIADVNNNQNIINTKSLLRINKEELDTLKHHYPYRYDGNIYTPAVHDYANDLDLFGMASLYQWMNRCFTEQGRNLMARDLLNGLPIHDIKQRQEAIKEIASEVEWRQQLQSFAMQTAITTGMEQKTTIWVEQEKEYFSSPVWKIVVLVYSIFSVSTAVAAILGYLHPATFSFLYALYLSISLILSRNTIKPYVHLSGIVKEVDTLRQLVQWIEEKKFRSSLLRKLQLASSSGNETAGRQIRELKNILDRFDLRLNIAGLLFFNSFLLWDVRQMIALNAWRKRNKTLVKKWFEMIATMEVLSSLATIHFNHPSWCLPQFNDTHFTFDATELGHPLIPAQNRIDNDFSLNGTGKIGLVTGSNMAGKSTFLRSLGVNIVLAQMGAPVCAGTFTLSPVHLMSSMRIADNLAENTSTFYAELKKLKTIIEAVHRQEQVFILLDEILRGTNSLDRHTGSEALIAQLIKEKAVAVIATHDLELAKLKEKFISSIEIYHFDVQVSGEELFFDYKLKPGVCTSLNASILMKKIGIQL